MLWEGWPDPGRLILYFNREVGPEKPRGARESVPACRQAELTPLNFVKGQPLRQGRARQSPASWLRACPSVGLQDSRCCQLEQQCGDLSSSRNEGAPKAGGTSSKLSPTRATSSWCDCRSRTRAAFSEAYMEVKSNMATSGCP